MYITFIKSYEMYSIKGLLDILRDMLKYGIFLCHKKAEYLTKFISVCQLFPTLKGGRGK